VPIEELQRKARAGDGGVGAGAQEYGQQDAEADRDAHECGVRKLRLLIDKHPAELNAELTRSGYRRYDLLLLDEQVSEKACATGSC
jgi:hypothetical protein